MIGTSASRGLCPCDPRIYRFTASPVYRLASLRLRRRAWPASAGLGPGIGARVASLRCPIPVRSRSVYAKSWEAALEICCANGFRSAKKDVFLSASVGRF